MHVLFSLLAPISLKNFDSVVRELAARGHRVTLLLHRADHAPGTAALFERMQADHPEIDVLHAPEPEPDRWLELAMDIRSTLDLLHFLDPRFSKTYRKRSFKRAATLVQRLSRHGWFRRRPTRGLATRFYRAIEESIPTSRTLRRFLAAQAPDLILFTPYVALRTVQPDYLRAARALGLRTAVAVYSWDNLTSKSTLRPIPELVLVWNEIQRQEAVKLHGVPAARIAVTGAQNFDEFFQRRPGDRAEFCRRAGMSSAEPFVLYTCFTPFKGTTSEVEFVLEWIESLRSSEKPILREVGIVVRPHPKRNAVWDDIDLSGYDDVVIWPRASTLPTDEEAKSGLFDSIHHSAAVVGLNTSAMIEAGILGRPVLTVLASQHKHSQAETLHFRYLTEVGGGLLQTANSLEEHQEQLEAAIEQRGSTGAERFVREFVRPSGIEQPATPLFVDALERLAASPSPRRRRTPPWAHLLRPWLHPLAARSAAAARRTREFKAWRRSETSR